MTNIKNPNYLISCDSEIHLVVDNNFYLRDNLQNQIGGNGIKVNGKNRPKDRYLFLNESLNNITFRLINTITSFDNMFKNDTSIISMDLSEIDIKLILSMKNMFSGCSNLKTVIFGNFEATVLRGMNSMFKGCTSLIYLQLFILPKREDPSPRITITNIFNGINPFVRYCINDSYTKDYLLGENAISICSDTCMDESNIKVDLVDNKCVKKCSNGRFIYKNTSICYGDCPHNSYPIFCDESECDENIRECFDETPENYYFDNSSQNYKKCYESCKYCYGEGNESNHNCIECKSELIFYNNLLNISNCYEICNDYYYFDESNEFHCSESCPEEYKLIQEKKKCIDECKNDDIYNNEYDNHCYDDCPNNIIKDETI